MVQLTTVLPRHSDTHDAFFCSLGSVEFGRDPAAPHHQDAIAQAEDFRQLRGNEQNAKSLVCELAHDCIDFRLGADIDAARRLVKNKNVRPRRQPLGQHDFLLIASRKGLHRPPKSIRRETDLSGDTYRLPALGAAPHETRRSREVHR